jgi:hypothetical protein
MNDFVQIRGYAIPFERTRFIATEGVVEVIDPHAFDDMLSRPLVVPVLWDSHGADAPIFANAATMFADDYGLGFAAMVDLRSQEGRLSPNWSRLRSMTSRNDPCDQCSVNLRIEKIERGRYGDDKLQRVVRASIDHIAITRNAAYGTMTGAWPTHVSISDAPWRIQGMAARWNGGRAAPKPRAKSAVSPPAALAAYMEPRRAHYRRVRESFALAMSSGKINGVALAHAAFTKAAGFDGNWRALAARARARG